MPHKKTKLSRSEGVGRSPEMAPGKTSLKNEAMPKSAARVLNAQKIRDDYRRKRKLEDGQPQDEPSKKRRRQETVPAQKTRKTTLVIQSGESLEHFNRRVEDDLRPLVKSAMQTARAIERNAAKDEKEARAAGSKSKRITGKGIDTPEESKHEEVSPALPPNPKEFATALPKRLNDVAQAPPEFKKLPRGASSFSSKNGDILSMSQKLLMEKERETIIQRYRELRAGQRPAKDPQ